VADVAREHSLRRVWAATTPSKPLVEVTGAFMQKIQRTLGSTHRSVKDFAPFPA
jgi:hypothetical protein